MFVSLQTYETWMTNLLTTNVILHGMLAKRARTETTRALSAVLIVVTEVQDCGRLNVISIKKKVTKWWICVSHFNRTMDW